MNGEKGPSSRLVLPPIGNIRAVWTKSGLTRACRALFPNRFFYWFRRTAAKRAELGSFRQPGDEYKLSPPFSKGGCFLLIQCYAQLKIFEVFLSNCTGGLLSLLGTTTADIRHFPDQGISPHHPPPIERFFFSLSNAIFYRMPKISEVHLGPRLR